MKTIKRLVNVLLIGIFIYLLFMFALSGYLSWKASENQLQVTPELITSHAIQYLSDERLILSGTQMDCSSFTANVYKRFGVHLPKSAKQQFKNLLIQQNEPKPADLVFFLNNKNTISHVGILLSDSSFIHSPGKNKPVRIDYLNSSYWSKYYAGTGSIISDQDKK